MACLQGMLGNSGANAPRGLLVGLIPLLAPQCTVLRCVPYSLSGWSQRDWAHSLPQQLTHGYTLFFFVLYPCSSLSLLLPGTFLKYMPGTQVLFSGPALGESQTTTRHRQQCSCIIKKNLNVPSKALFSASWYPHALVWIPQK